MFVFSSLIVQAVELVQFPFISLQACSCAGDGEVAWGCGWALGWYRTPCAVNSSDPWILNINVLVFPVTFTGALTFGLLCALQSSFPFTSIVTQPYDEDAAQYFQYGFQPFLRAVLRKSHYLFLA